MLLILLIGNNIIVILIRTTIENYTIDRNYYINIGWMRALDIDELWMRLM